MSLTIQRERKSMLAVNLGLAANIFLAGLKTAIGILGHSPALLAEGINSTSDVAYYIVIALFLRLSRKPADHEHPYGHSQLESIAALVVGAFVVTTAIAIFWDAVNNVFDLLMGQGNFGGATVGALCVVLFTVAVKIVLTCLTRRFARQTNNPTVLALAYDHRNDVFSASAAALGIFLGRMGYPWVDPLAGALVALIILHTGLKILREASSDLMSTVPGRLLAQQIAQVASAIPGVRQIEEIQGHRLGPYLIVHLTIGVDGTCSVADGDAIASQVEQALSQHVEFLRRVHIHYHPA